MQNLPDAVLAKIRRTLEEQKKATVQRIAELNAQDPFSNPDRLSDNAATDMEATEESSHDRFAALTEELTRKVADIDAVLLEISAGTYGICAHCGGEISQDRLTVLPTSRLCLACEQAKKA